jgi:hypothetical protein
VTCVWIAYEPQVFREALIHLLSRLESVSIVEKISDDVDVGIFRLADTGKLQDFFRHKTLPQAKLIVFSPRGDKAFIRLPGEASWKKVHPFGMSQLLAEIQAGRDKSLVDMTKSVSNQHPF